jgi:hypothetical protein
VEKGNMQAGRVDERPNQPTQLNLVERQRREYEEWEKDIVRERKRLEQISKAQQDAKSEMDREQSDQELERDRLEVKADKLRQRECIMRKNMEDMKKIGMESALSERVELPEPDWGL